MNQKNLKILLRLDNFHEKCQLDKWKFLVEELIKGKLSSYWFDPKK